MSDVAAELTALNQAFATAERTGDASFFRRHLADGLVFRRASGKTADKRTFLEDLVAEGNTNDLLEAEAIEVLPYGEDMALCSLLVRFKGIRGGKRADGLYRNSRVFVRSGGVWQCPLWFNTKEGPI
jgi:ketosteroid isomerase-like protein